MSDELSQARAGAVTHVRDAERFRIVELTWPVTFEGKTYERITVSRMSVRQLGVFMDTIESKGRLSDLPMFDVPREVIEELDADDGDKLDEAAADFLPRRFRVTAGSVRTDGASTLQSLPSVSADNASNT